MSFSAPTALVVAAPTLLRQGIVATLREHWPQLLLTLTADVTQLPDLVACRSFGLVVLDGMLASSHLLPDLLGHLHRIRPTQRLLLLLEQHLSAQHLGPLAWPGTALQLPRQVPPATLAAALAPWLDTANGTNGPPPACNQAPVGYALFNPFSARELEVLRLVVADQCNREIADRLCLSVRTVESHRRMLLQKAGTRTVVGLAARAVREGWVA